MKKNSITFLLVAAVFLTTLAAAGLCYSYLRKSRTLRDVQAQIVVVNQRRQMMGALAADLNEVGRQNPSIVPMLEQLNVSLRNAVMTTNRSGGRP